MGRITLSARIENHQWRLFKVEKGMRTETRTMSWRICLRQSVYTWLLCMRGGLFDALPE